MTVFAYRQLGCFLQVGDYVRITEELQLKPTAIECQKTEATHKVIGILTDATGRVVVEDLETINERTNKENGTEDSSVVRFSLIELK